MKISLLFAISALLINGCRVLDEYPSNVKVLKKNDSFSYSLTGQGFSKKSFECQTVAEKNIFEVLLFRGISGTDLINPLVENEKITRDNNKEFFRDFFDRKGYREFISSSVEMVEPIKKISGGYTCSVEFSINLNSLKKKLEQNGIIRKFGL